MSDPSEQEIAAAQKAVQLFRKQINDSAALTSLLYDIDLLPEQIRLLVNATRMAAFCILFAKLTPEQAASLFVQQKPK